MGGKEGTDYPETIKKRNGTQVPFDAQKIRDAVRKANEAAQVEAISPMQFHDLIEEIIAAIPRDSIPEVEQVQDIVEEKLIAGAQVGSRSGKDLPGTYLQQRGGRRHEAGERQY